MGWKETNNTKNNAESWFFKKINMIDKHFAKLNKRVKTLI